MLKELLAKLDTLNVEMRKILTLQETEKRNLTADENTKYRNLEAEYSETEARYKAEQDMEKRGEFIASQKKTANIPPVVGEPSAQPENRSDADRAKEERRAAFCKYLQTGENNLLQKEKEQRSLYASADSAGGYLAPEQMANEIVSAIKSVSVIRSLATVQMIRGAGSLGIPTIEAYPEDADWTAEITAITEDTAMTFGKRELKPNLLTKRIKISSKLLRVSPFDAERLVTEALAYKIGISEENAFLNGDGASKPLGVFFPSADGVTTSQDVNSGGATSITADGVVNMFYKLREGYRQKATWVCHPDFLAKVRVMKDGTGVYIWVPGMAEAPATILGRPVRTTEKAPNTFTGDKYVAVLGDFSYYRIAQNMDIEIQRLAELFSGNNQIGFDARMDVDGMPVLSEAFARMKMHA